MTTISARRFLLAFAGTFLGDRRAAERAFDSGRSVRHVGGTRIAPEKGYEKFGRVRVASDRVVKGLMLSRDRYDMLLIGSSRALFGFDCAHPAFAGRRVYNGAFIGATAPENASVLAYALARQSGLKDALIGLDLFAFARLKAFGDDDQSAFAGASLAAGYASRVLSKDALDGSTRFWQSLRGRAVARMSLDGFQQPEPEWLRHRRKLLTRIVGVGTHPDRWGAGGSRGAAGPGHGQFRQNRPSGQGARRQPAFLSLADPCLGACARGRRRAHRRP